MTLKDQIVSHLFKKGDWVHKGNILDHKFYYTNSPKTYLSSGVDRELRMAETESSIARKDDKNSKSTMYKYIPERYRKYYIPWSQRPGDAKEVLFREPLTN